MKIELSLDTRAIQKRLNEYSGDIQKNADNAIFAAAQYGINLILARTKSGLGVKGAFKPYSPKYAIFRTKSGRQSNNVDLNFTGSMLNAMTARKGRGFAEIGFTRAYESKKAYYNNKDRYFFGFNATEKKKITTFIRRRVFR
jgi:hypothetical protein